MEVDSWTGEKSHVYQTKILSLSNLSEVENHKQTMIDSTLV